MNPYILPMANEGVQRATVTPRFVQCHEYAVCREDAVFDRLKIIGVDRFALPAHDADQLLE
jgi:hypothetical protein